MERVSSHLGTRAIGPSSLWETLPPNPTCRCLAYPASLYAQVVPVSRVAHSVLIAHGCAVKLYREQFQPHQNGTIGITLDSGWFEPYTNTQESEHGSRLMYSVLTGIQTLRLHSAPSMFD